MEVLGKGVFTWEGFERRSDRYGSFFLAESSFEGHGKMTPKVNKKLARKLEGKRVRITVRVLETRKSGHIGDIFNNIFPSTPERGEVIELGVGIFKQGPEINGHPQYFLQPGDGRESMWIDPYKLYRCHDQTVEVLAAETDSEFSEVPNLAEASKGLISNGDGSYQVKSKNKDGVTLLDKKVIPMGDGMFLVSAPNMGPSGTFHPTTETARVPKQGRSR